MIASITYSERDIGQLKALLRALPATHANQALRAGLRAYARVVARTARRSTAFADRTGTLRKSIKSGPPARQRRRRGVVTQTVHATAPHAHLLELGTSRMRKRPFLFPAVENSRAAAMAAAGAATRRKAALVARKLIAKYPTGRRK